MQNWLSICSLAFAVRGTNPQGQSSPCPAARPEDLWFHRKDGRHVLGKVGQIGQEGAALGALQRRDKRFFRIKPQPGKTVTVEIWKTHASAAPFEFGNPRFAFIEGSRLRGRNYSTKMALKSFTLV